MTAKSCERVAVFPGTFSPYTIGHDDILRRALGLFDRVVIVVGINAGKGAEPSAEERARAISAVYADEPRVKVEVWDGLTVDACRHFGAGFIVRGVRSVKDYEYERDMADANAAIDGVETVILFARPELAWISSSVLRDIAAHGRDIAEYLP